MHIVDHIDEMLRDTSRKWQQTCVNRELKLAANISDNLSTTNLEIGDAYSMSFAHTVQPVTFPSK
jgi:hypothetical protein